MREIQRHGQSVWYDAIGWDLVASGELARLMAEGVSGVMTNPALPAAAVTGDGGRADARRQLAAQGQEPAEVYETLAIREVRAAADVLRPVYDRTEGRDGFVSLPVSPELAHDGSGTVNEAQRLLDAVGRPNIMIAVPGTAAGIWAIEELVAGGISVNATLLFSVDRYRAVARAYLAGLERCIESGGTVRRVASVASFFLSRLDRLVNRRLEAEISTAGSDAERRALEGLRSQAAIASAKTAYAEAKTLFSGRQWARLAAAGARPQRLLWASPVGADAALDDRYYIEALVGRDTVAALSPSILTAVRERARIRPTLEAGLPAARAVLRRLEAAGVHLARVAEQLEEDGVRAVRESFDRAIADISSRRQLATRALV